MGRGGKKLVISKRDVSLITRHYTKPLLAADTFYRLPIFIADFPANFL